MATCAHVALSMICIESTGTSGSWWWMMSNFSWRSMRFTSQSRRSESVIRPMLPLKGIAIARPTGITSRACGSSPHGAVMMRTSCPSSRSRSYVSRM